MTRALPGLPSWQPAWPAFSAHGSLVLPLPVAAIGALASQVEVEHLVLERKHEFHFTLLNRELGARVQQAIPKAVRGTRLPALFAALDWAWRGTGERWLLREAMPAGDRHSIIELVEMPALARFRAAVGELLEASLPDPPPHLTLYVAGDRSGIGLASQAEFEHLRLHHI